MVELQRGERAQVVMGEVARVHDFQAQRLAQEQVDRRAGQAARFEVALHGVAQRLGQGRVRDQHQRRDPQQPTLETRLGFQRRAGHAAAGGAEGHHLRCVAGARLAAIEPGQLAMQRPAGAQGLRRVVQGAGEREAGRVHAGQQPRQVAGHRIDQRRRLLGGQAQRLRGRRLRQLDREQRRTDGGIGAGHAGRAMAGARV